MENWRKVEEYIVDHLIEKDSALNSALKRIEEAGLPQHSVSPSEGKMLYLLTRVQKAKNILEIGTLGAYSTIWMGKALPSDGRLLTLEINSDYARIAKANLEQAGLSNVVDLRIGHAMETLERLSREITEPFDLVFIDADKRNSLHYFEWALKLSREGSLIIVDNVIRGGIVINQENDSASIRGVRQLFEKLSSDRRVSATAIQTVGMKGHDGFILAVVNG